MRSIRSIVMVFLLVTSVASNAFGSFYPAVPGKLEPEHLRWKDRLIKIAISESVFEANSNIKTGSDVIGAVRRSIRAWQDVSAIEIEFELSAKRNVSPAGLSGDGVSLISIAPSAENVLLFSKDPDAESAKTRVFYNRKNFITESDIILNPYQQFSTDGTFGTFDLESTLTHELGHMLGMRHSSILGSIMSSSLAKNGIFGVAEPAARSLAENDIAAIRELYGPNVENGICCGAIVGRLVTGTVRGGRELRVWAEDSVTGRVVAQVDATADGSFVLGGLSPGIYSVFWQKDIESGTSDVGNLGTVNVSKDEIQQINEKVVLNRSDVSLRYVGINTQLANSSVTLRAGRDYTIYLGGKNLDRKKIAIEFNSPFLTVDSNSFEDQDFGEDISVVKFTMTVHPSTPVGVYSIFAGPKQEALNALLGAIKIQ